MKFKLLGTKIYVSFIFVSLITFMIATDRTGYIIPTAVAVIFHELGHLFAMWLFDCSPKEIRLIPTSVEIIRSFSLKPYGETVIAVMGPAVNILLFLVFLINYKCFNSHIFLVFSLINIVIGVFNLLPVRGLDGGTALHNVISKKFGIDTATKIITILTLILGFIVLTLGFFLLFNKCFNPTVFIVAIYLFIAALLK